METNENILENLVGRSIANVVIDAHDGWVIIQTEQKGNMAGQKISICAMDNVVVRV